MEKAKRILRTRLGKEFVDFVGLPIGVQLEGKPVEYNGKGERFEFRAIFDTGVIRFYEVTVYGEGRSYRIWEM